MNRNKGSAGLLLRWLLNAQVKFSL